MDWGIHVLFSKRSGSFGMLECALIRRKDEFLFCPCEKLSLFACFKVYCSYRICIVKVNKEFLVFRFLNYFCLGYFVSTLKALYNDRNIAN